MTSVLEAYEYGLNTTTDTEDMTGNPEQENDIVLKVRGIRNGSLGRNYFAWGNNSDVCNTERLTFSRGPNSVIFGIGGVGGIINTDTKRAFFGRLHGGRFEGLCNLVYVDFKKTGKDGAYVAKGSTRVAVLSARRDRCA